MFLEDLSAFFRDFGVTATAGSLSCLALFDAPDEPTLNDRATSSDYALTFPTGALGEVTYRTAIVVTGTPESEFDGNYLVRTVDNLEDGRLQRATLEAQ